MSQLRSKRRVMFVSFLALALLIGVALLANSAQAQPDASGQSSPPASTRNGFAHLEPVGSAPPNGGTVQAGTKFTLDLKVNAGSNTDPNGVTAAQEYMQFTNSVLQVVSPSASCSSAPPPNMTITTDSSMFESVLQNETCNGPNPCNFRGVYLAPGRIGFASGALSNCPHGCAGDFRVATITLCAVAGGRGEISFEFAPPAPTTRDTEIVALNGDQIQSQNLYHSYVVNVTGPTATPGPPTWTPGPACAMTFKDLGSDNEFYQYIQELYCRSTNPRIVTGFADGTFRPYDNTKRAQLAKLIVLAFRIPLATGTTQHFTDVPPTGATADAYKYIETAFNSGIITGFDNHLFKPWDFVKRGQVAKMVVKAAGLQTNLAGGPHFTDVPPTNEFYQYVETALNGNIITGFDDHTFRPYAYATRGQICKIVAGASQ